LLLANGPFLRLYGNESSAYILLPLPALYSGGRSGSG
jgi:hypothetical protein